MVDASSNGGSPRPRFLPETNAESKLITDSRVEFKVLSPKSPNFYLVSPEAPKRTMNTLNYPFARSNHKENSDNKFNFDNKNLNALPLSRIPITGMTVNYNLIPGLFTSQQHNIIDSACF